MGKNLFFNVYIVFFYLCSTFHDVNIDVTHVLIGHDICQYALNIMLFDVCISFYDPKIDLSYVNVFWSLVVTSLHSYL